MTIRYAEPADFPRLIDMGCRFLTETSYSRFITPDREAMSKTIEKIRVGVMEQDERIVGMIGFIVYPHPLSGEMVSGEVMWWVEPEMRGKGIKLLRWAENEARQAGARLIQMIAPDIRVGSLYRRLGYSEVETTYQRRLA